MRESNFISQYYSHITRNVVAEEAKDDTLVDAWFMDQADSVWYKHG